MARQFFKEPFFTAFLMVLLVTCNMSCSARHENDLATQAPSPQDTPYAVQLHIDPRRVIPVNRFPFGQNHLKKASSEKPLLVQEQFDEFFRLFFTGLPKNDKQKARLDAEKLFTELWKGQWVSSQITFPNGMPLSGASSKTTDKSLPFVGIAVQDNEWLRVLMANRHPTLPATVTLTAEDIQPKSWIVFDELQKMNDAIRQKRPALLQGLYQWENGRLMETRLPLHFDVEPESLILLKFEVTQTQPN